MTSRLTLGSLYAVPWTLKELIQEAYLRDDDVSLRHRYLEPSRAVHDADSDRYMYFWASFVSV